MKTCIYAIALNEVKFVDRFMQASQDADLVLVCDTGSIDGTTERLKELGATVYHISQNPWRFDIPRNTALNLIPHDIDICLSVDLDEVLQPDWKSHLEVAWNESNGLATRFSYEYTWSWQNNGDPDVVFFADKIHIRNNYIWKHPCHETLYYTHPQGIEIKKQVDKLKLYHYPDKEKSRGNYLNLLQLAVYEDPSNDRMCHYYARELLYKGCYPEAIKEFKRHLQLPSAQWKEERASSLRYIARCYLLLNKPTDAQDWATKSTIEWPYSREPWIELAKISLINRDWSTAFWASTKCINITTRTNSYITEGSSWGSLPYEYAAISALNLNLKNEALINAAFAISHGSANPQLASIINSK